MLFVWLNASSYGKFLFNVDSTFARNSALNLLRLKYHKDLKAECLECGRYSIIVDRNGLNKI